MDICAVDPNSGQDISPACHALLDEVYAAAEALIEDALSDGMTNLVYMGYYRNSYTLFDTVMDISMDRTRDIIEEKDLLYPNHRLVFVDPRDAFEGHPEYILEDGIHPTTAGSEVLANMIWDAMVANDIEQ